MFFQQLRVRTNEQRSTMFLYNKFRSYQRTRITYNIQKQQLCFLFFFVRTNEQQHLNTTFFFVRTHEQQQQFFFLLSYTRKQQLFFSSNHPTQVDHVIKTITAWCEHFSVYNKTLYISRNAVVYKWASLTQTIYTTYVTLPASGVDRYNIDIIWYKRKS